MKLEEEIRQEKFTDEIEKVVVNILFTGGWLSTISNSLLKSYGISTQQYNVLRILKGQCSKPAMLGLIQERMLDKMSNATRLVDKLMEKGLVIRNQCPKDRRQVDILITEKGIQLLNEVQPQMQKMNDDFFGLSVEEAKVLNQLLDKFRK